MFTTGYGQELVKVHPIGACFGKWCVIHTPMPGPWQSWPTLWREDARFMERVCPCGVGHPVVEDHWVPGSGNGAHGCCGVHRCFLTLEELESLPGHFDGEVVEVSRELER